MIFATCTRARDSNQHRQSVSAGKTNAIPTEPSGRLYSFNFFGSHFFLFVRAARVIFKPNCLQNVAPKMGPPHSPVFGTYGGHFCGRSETRFTGIGGPHSEIQNWCQAGWTCPSKWDSQRRSSALECCQSIWQHFLPSGKVFPYVTSYDRCVDLRCGGMCFLQVNDRLAAKEQSQT